MFHNLMIMMSIKTSIYQLNFLISTAVRANTNSRAEATPRDLVQNVSNSTQRISVTNKQTGSTVTIYIQIKKLIHKREKETSS